MDKQEGSESHTGGTPVCSNELLAHCCFCHETFLESDVLDVQGGGDECPKCHEQGFTICLDGNASCACGEGANDTGEPRLPRKENHV